MKIAFVRLSALGDIVHSMIVLQFVKKHFPHIQIDWITQKNFIPLLKNNPHIKNVKGVDLKRIKKEKSIYTIIETIKSIKDDYDLVIDLQGLIKSAILTPFLSQKRVGPEMGCAREWLATLFYTQKIVVPCERNVIDRNLLPVSKTLGFCYTKEEIENKEPYLFWEKKDYSFLDKLLGKRNILIVPSSSQPNKNYPLNKWIDVVNQLIDAKLFILWGNEEEKRRAKEIVQKSKAHLAPKLSLNDLKYFIHKMDLVIGGDTGPTHMAWALNKPSIVLFGYTTPNLMYQTKRNVALFVKEVDPCRWDKSDGCIDTIKPKQIVQKAKEILER